MEKPQSDTIYKDRYIQKQKLNHCLIARKRVDAKQKVLLIGHIDTVYPVLEKQLFEVENNWCLGSGIADMKGGISCDVRSYKKFERQSNGQFGLDNHCNK